MNPTATQTAVPPTQTPYRRQRINPVLIKELRQGVRSRRYVLIFLAIQLVMVIYLLMLVFAQKSDTGSNPDYLFWWLIGIFLLVCLPLGAVNALNSENRAGRLELLLLTGLSTRAIVYGKWLAIVAQGALLVTALLPYLVLRYYIDSSEFHETLISLLLMLAGSAFLTGASVSLSAIRTTLLRYSLLAFGCLFVLPAVIGSLSMRFYNFDMLHAYLPVLLTTGLLLILLCMEFAAAHLNPIEQNHDTAKRLLVWGLLATGLYALFHRAELELPIVIFAAAFATVAWDALRRTPSSSPTIYEPFVKRGWAGRLAGRLFYPGWPSAFSFCLLTLALTILISLLQTPSIDMQELWAGMWYLAAVVGVYTFPFALVICTPFGRRKTGLSMLLVQLTLLFLVVLLHLIDEITSLQTVSSVCWTPTGALLLDWLDDSISDPRHAMHNVSTIGALLTTGLSVLFIFIKALPQRRFILQMERTALANLQERKQGQTASDSDAMPALPGSEIANR